MPPTARCTIPATRGIQIPKTPLAPAERLFLHLILILACHEVAAHVGLLQLPYQHNHAEPSLTTLNHSGRRWGGRFRQDDSSGVLALLPGRRTSASSKPDPGRMRPLGVTLYDSFSATDTTVYNPAALARS